MPKKYVLITTKYSDSAETWFGSSLYRINPENGKTGAVVYTASRFERDRAISACIHGSGISVDDIEIEAVGI